MVSTKHSNSGPRCPGFDSQQSQIFFRRKKVNVAEVNQQCSLEESGQRLDNFDCTHLVLASGKLELGGARD